MDEITPFPTTDDPGRSDIGTSGIDPPRAQRAGTGTDATATGAPEADVPHPLVPDPDGVDPDTPVPDPDGVDPDTPASDPPEPEDLQPKQRPTLHLDRPAEVLAWLPYQVQFWPHESAVLVSMRQADRATTGLDGPSGPTPLPRTSGSLEPGLIARTDLGVIGGQVGARQAQVEMGRHLQRDGAHRVLCAIYTEQTFASVLRGQGPAGRTLAWWRTTPWAELGKTYLIGPERFRCVDCADAPCCPHTGQPLEVLDNTEAAVWHVFHGRGYVRDRQDLVSDARASSERRRAVSAAARRHYDRRPGRLGTDRSAWHREMERRWVALVSACDPATCAGTTPTADARPAPADEQVPADDLGAVLGGFADTWVRDAALLWSGSGQLLGDAVRDNVVDAVFSGRLLPQMRRLRAAERTLTVLAAHATEQWMAPILAARAWLAWWSGEGARANILLERTLAVDPEYSLAQLLGTALVHGIPPGWARRPHAS